MAEGLGVAQSTGLILAPPIEANVALTPALSSTAPDQFSLVNNYVPSGGMITPAVPAAPVMPVDFTLGRQASTADMVERPLGALSAGPTAVPAETIDSQRQTVILADIGAPAAAQPAPNFLGRFKVDVETDRYHHVDDIGISKSADGKYVVRCYYKGDAVYDEMTLGINSCMAKAISILLTPRQA